MKKLFTTLAAISMVASAAIGQSENSEKKSIFNPLPNNSWAIGAFVGPAYIMGDIADPLTNIVDHWRLYPGFEFGVLAEKSLTPRWSVRFQTSYIQYKGIHASPLSTSQLADLNFGIYGSPAAPTSGQLSGYAKKPGTNLRANYRLQGSNSNALLIYNHPLMDFKQSSLIKKVNGYVMGGFGLFASETRFDIKDASGKAYNVTSNKISTIKDQMDGTYDVGAKYSSGTGQGLFGYDGHVEFTSILGAGLDLKVNEKWDIFGETQFAFVNSDYLDGVAVHYTGAPSSGNDGAMTMRFGAKYRLGSIDKTYWFSESASKRNSNLNADMIAKLSKDSDGDGVSDYFDKDNSTPANTIVDGSGRALKSAAPESLVDTDGDGIHDNKDVEPNSPANAIVNFQGKAITNVTAQKTLTDQIVNGLTTVFFEIDQSFVKSEYLPVVYAVIDVMKANKDYTVNITGHADKIGSDSYNEKLGQRRADAVKAIMVASGISEGRISTSTKGATETVREGKKSDNLSRRAEIKISVK